MKLSLLCSIAGIYASSLKDALGSKGEEFRFETEVNQVMDIIIHSLYKSKDVFLRELISNSADALDKIRLAGLTDKTQLETNPDLKIYITADKEEKTLTIRDTGIGMNHDQLRDNLGTIAKSGTSEFIKAMKDKNSTDPGLIGKFGVGFYSAFLVADSVAVVSKSNGADQYIWQSSSQSNFKIIKDPRGDTLKRGTEIVLRIKDAEVEFLETNRLKEIVQKHSEFINFPVYLWNEKTIEIPAEESDDDATPEGDEDEDIKDAEVDEPPVEKKPVTKTVFDWELLNENKPIWTRNPADVTENEYNSFYKSHFKEHTEPIAHKHFKLEGDAEFNVLIYIPGAAPPRFMQPDAASANNVELFVRRVFITNDLNEFLPKWLSFLKVIIDSDDLPLNVSRETLQNHSSLKLVKNKLISKALDLLIELAEKQDNEMYRKIHSEFGKAFRYGLYDAKASHKKKLTNLLRFESSVEDFVSLEQYKNRMKNNQPQIYFSTGVNAKAARTSPFAEKIISRGYEILFFLDPIEEYLTQGSMTEYESLPLQNVAKSGLKFGDEDDSSKEKEEELKEKYAPLTDWLKEALEKYVKEVKVSFHLQNTAAVVIPQGSGLSASQERMFAVQYAGKENDPMFQFYMSQPKALEINPHHPLIERLLTVVEEKEKEPFKYLPAALYEIYSVGSGWDVRNPKRFMKRVELLLKLPLGVDVEAKPKIDITPAPETPKAHLDEKPVVKDDDDELDSHVEL
jgi:heat shock protein 90kDa beta